MAGARARRFYTCGCFYTDNIFLQDYRLHVSRAAAPDLRPILQSRGCKTEEQFKEVQAKIDQEVQRRRLLSQASLERAAIISAHYKPLNPAVYILQENFLAPEFREIVAYCRSKDADFEGLLDRIQSLPAKRVYSFPVFTVEFCRQLVEELENFECSDMPKGRPNTMNNYGVMSVSGSAAVINVSPPTDSQANQLCDSSLPESGEVTWNHNNIVNRVDVGRLFPLDEVLLNELGFDETFITSLREDYLQPITSLLYPDYGGQGMDSHKAFVVKYAVNQDRDLSFHYDNAEVTLNVSLGKDFNEGNLYFGDMRQVRVSQSECVEIEHRVGHGLLHRGQHCHGALPISSGERWNLIVWMRSSQVRNQLCPMCDRKPQLEDAVGFGDGFTATPSEDQRPSVDVCSLN